MRNDIARPIGVFDSGMGGLTVLKELINALPHEQIIYLGDTARVPYGNKSPQTVTRYSFENTKFLLKKGIKLLIIACNTASAYSIEAIKSRFPVPCLGVIQPGASAAVRKTNSGKVAVIGTIGTIMSQAYPKAIHALRPDILIYEKACPLFVPLVEEGWIDNEVTQKVAERYLGQFAGKGIDVVILGCTHYPLIKQVISDSMGAAVNLVDSAKETASDACHTLKNLGLLAPHTTQGGYQIYVTDLPDQFSRIASVFLGKDTAPAVQVTLEEMV